MRFKTIIIGMGPSGISCAIYLKRFGIEPLVLGKDYGALEKAHLIENYYAKGPVSGKDLVMDGIKEAYKLGVTINHDEVIAIDYLDKGFLVTTKKATYEADTIYLAVGKSRNSLSYAKKYEGKGVSYCASCDGFFYRKKKVALIGYNSYMAHELAILAKLIDDITIFTDGNELEVEVDSKYKVVKDKIVDFMGEDSFTGIKTEKEIYEFNGCFIALGSASGFSLAKHLGIILDENNNIVVNKNMETNIKGIYAGGDAIGGILQVVKAASDGASAAYELNKALKTL